MEFSCTVEEFFEDGLDVTFVDTLCAFLDISTDRVKIVGIRSVERSVSRRVLEDEVEEDEFENRILQGEDGEEADTNVEVVYVISDGESIGNDESGYDAQE